MNGKQLQNLVERVKVAQQLAKIAVDFDNKHDYVNAAAQYRDTIDSLENELNIAPEANRSAISELIIQYKNRLELLEQIVPPVHAVVKNPLRFKRETNRTPISDPPPSNPALKTYWLMRVLAKSIQTGGYLTPQIYVPKAVWYQEGAKFQALHTKVEAIGTLQEGILKLKDLTMEDQETAKEYLFCTTLGELQHSLAKQLYFISEFKEDKEKKQAFGHQLAKRVVGLMKGKEMDDSSQYMSSLLEFFESCQFLEKWHVYYVDSQPLSQGAAKMKRISEFFQSVVCAFVMKDLQMLIERYMKYAKESFDRTEPPKK